MPVKSIVALRAAPVDGHGDGDDAAVVHLLAEGAVAEAVDDPAHGLLGVVLHVLHVGRDDRKAELGDHAPQLGRAARVGGHLGAQVGEVLGEVAHGVRSRREQGGRLRFAELAASTSRKSSTSTPSSSMRRLPGGIEPGVTPPTSA